MLSLLLFAGLAAAQPTWPSLDEPAAEVGGGANDAAVIIGIEDYFVVQDIPGAVDNANAWYDWFTVTRGVPLSNVHIVRNGLASREKILEEAEWGTGRVKDGGTLWYVFIGHGAPAKDGHDGLLVGADAQQTASSLYARSVKQSELLAKLKEGPQAHSNLVLDACFSGQTGGGALVEGLMPMVPTYVLATGGATIFTAGMSDQFAGPLPGARRPAFSYLLLGALRGWGDEDQSGDVTAAEAIAYTEGALTAMLTDRAQTPQLSGTETGVLAKGTEKGPDLRAMIRAGVGAAPVASGPATTPDFAVDIDVDAALREQECSQFATTEATKQRKKRLDAAAMDSRKSIDATWAKLKAQSERCAGLDKDATRKLCRDKVAEFSTFAKAAKVVESEGFETVETDCGSRRIPVKKTSLAGASKTTLSQVKSLLGSYDTQHRLVDYCATPQACFELGTNPPPPKSPGGSKAWHDRQATAFRKACDGNHYEGCHQLGIKQISLSNWPSISEKTKTEAITEGLQALEKACDGGIAPGCTSLGEAYREGRYITKNYTTSINLFNRACDAGDGKGCSFLGRSYLAGQGVTKNITTAVAYFWQGCNGDYSYACRILGSHYRDGRDIPQDYGKAVALYQTACDRGEDDLISCGFLGQMYRRGNGVAVDYNKARALLTPACNVGFPWACEDLKGI